jgi:hypothetical protein
VLAASLYYIAEMDRCYMYVTAIADQNNEQTFGLIKKILINGLRDLYGTSRLNGIIPT